MVTRNEKGVTLLEILISITIFSIILVSIMKFFPQITFTNKLNADKTQAINTARQILIEWQNSSNVKSFLKRPSSSPVLPAPLAGQDSEYYYFQTKEKFDEKIIIKRSAPPNFPSGSTEPRYIEIQLFSNSGTVLTKTYGYIILKVSD